MALGFLQFVLFECLVVVSSCFSFIVCPFYVPHMLSHMCHVGVAADLL